jgi:phage terminase small subunit
VYHFDKEGVMSRSYKKTPFSGNSKAESDKSAKQQAHQAERARVRSFNRGDIEDVELLATAPKQAFSNVYTFPKDGKHYRPLPFEMDEDGEALRMLREEGPWQDLREAHKALAK